VTLSNPEQGITLVIVTAVLRDRGDEGTCRGAGGWGGMGRAWHASDAAQHDQVCVSSPQNGTDRTNSGTTMWRYLPVQPITVQLFLSNCFRGRVHSRWVRLLLGGMAEVSNNQGIATFFFNMVDP
jgi:hypothetical protein